MVALFLGWSVRLLVVGVVGGLLDCCCDLLNL